MCTAICVPLFFHNWVGAFYIKAQYLCQLHTPSNGEELNMYVHVHNKGHPRHNHAPILISSYLHDMSDERTHVVHLHENNEKKKYIPISREVARANTKRWRMVAHVLPHAVCY